MSDLEIPDKTARRLIKKTYERILEPGGVYISGLSEDHQIQYSDVNDFPEIIDLSLKVLLANDPYPDFFNFNLGDIGKRFRILCLKDSQIIQIMNLREFPANPHGYGVDDFLYSKFIYPDFRKTGLARLMDRDLMHLIFSSNLVKRIYFYALGKAGEDKLQGLDKIDDSARCIIFKPQDKDNLKYISISGSIDTEKGKFFIIEGSAAEYLLVDQKKYLKDLGFSKKRIDEWSSRMDEGMAKVKKEK